MTRAVFRVPVASVGTNIHKKDDLSWLQPSDDIISSGSSRSSRRSRAKVRDDEHTHPYDREPTPDNKKQKDKQPEFSTLHPEQES